MMQVVERSASVYRRKGLLLIQAELLTTAGVWISTAPCDVLPLDTDDEELARVIRVGLDRSRTGVPHPRDWKSLTFPILMAAGVKSWRAFSRGATLVGVKVDGEALSLTPFRNAGPKDGFEPEASRPIAWGDLAATVRQLLAERAESA